MLRRFEPSFAQLGRMVEAGEIDGVELPLFDGAAARLVIRDHQPLGADSGTITARAENEPLSHVVLSYAGDAQAGIIQLPERGRFYEIRNASPNGAAFVIEIEPGKIPGCEHCAPAPDGR